MPFSRWKSGVSHLDVKIWQMPKKQLWTCTFWVRILVILLPVLYLFHTTAGSSALDSAGWRREFGGYASLATSDCNITFFREQYSSLIAVYTSSVYGPSPCKSSLDDACTDPNETKHVGCRSFLDLHKDELVPRAKSLGDKAACLVVEVCTNEELSDDTRMMRGKTVGEVDVQCASGVDRPVV